jgi:hypothetical protein
MRHAELKSRYMQGRNVSFWRCGIASGVVLMVLLPATSWGCAVCWGGDDALAHSISVSILFLMSMPFLIGGSIFGIIFVAYKRARGVRWPSLSIKNVAWMQKEAKK